MEQEIDLRDILVILRRRLWMIIAMPVIAMLVAAVMVFYVMTPVYEASTTLLVGKNETATAAQTTSLAYQDVLLNQQLVKTYGEIAKSRSVADEVIRSMGLPLTAQELSTKINVSLVTGTQIISLVVSDPDPVFAQQIANTTAGVFVKRVPELTKLNNLTIIDQALTPLAPVKPKKALTITVAVMVGLMVGLGLAFVLEYLDNTLKTKEDVESHLGLPVLGLIPKIQKSA